MMCSNQIFKQSVEEEWRKRNREKGGDENKGESVSSINDIGTESRDRAQTRFRSCRWKFVFFRLMYQEIQDMIPQCTDRDDKGNLSTRNKNQN